MSKSCGVSEKKFANPTLLQDLPGQLGTVCPLATQAFAKCVVSRRSSMSLRMNGGKDASVTAKLADQTCKHPVSLGSRKACLLSSTASMSYYDMRSVSGEETCYVDSGLGRSGCRRGLSLGRVLSWKKCKKSHKYQCSLRMLVKNAEQF